MGPEYYTFRASDIAGIVLHSNLQKGTKNVPDEATKMERWFQPELAKAKASGAKHILVFQHGVPRRTSPDSYFAQSRTVC